MKKFFKKIPFDYRSQPNVFWNHCFVAIASYVVGLIMTVCFGIFTGFSFNTYNPDVPKIAINIFMVFVFIYALAYIGLVIFVRIVDINTEEDEYLILENHLALANFGGLPSLTLPLCMSEGMPIGLNITCKAFDEIIVFDISAFIVVLTTCISSIRLCINLYNLL